MKKAIFFLTAFLLWINLSYADNYHRQKDIDVQHYTFRLALSDSTNSITGVTSAEIKFVTAGVTEFHLDLVGKSSPNSVTGMTVSSVKNDGGSTVNFRQKDDELIFHLNRPSSKDELRTFVISYSGIPADGLIISKNKFGERTFFGDNWPDRARYWLPTIDHPYDKATCDFIVTAPPEYKVIANGSLVEESLLPNVLKLTHWKESEPVPTKVMVIGAARFAVQYLPKFNCVPVESWVYPKDREKGFYDFSVAEKIIKLFTSLIGPFPYEKLANVESKTKYGGMENASNIFYAEKEVTGTRKNESTVAHEIAHQWFGDAVSENDWDHIWLSEGFATFFQNFYVGKAFGQDSLINLLNHDKDLIIRYDDYYPDKPIVDTTVTDLNKLLNVNSYQKGAWALRMLRHVLGEKVFWKGIRLYYSTFRNKNALTKDFEAVMEKASGKDLAWFFDEWLYKPGIPYFKGGWHYDKINKKLEIKIEQIQKYGELFNMPVDIEIYNDDSSDHQIKNLRINKKVNKFEIELNKNPSAVKLDPGNFVLMRSDFKRE